MVTIGRSVKEAEISAKVKFGIPSPFAMASGGVLERIWSLAEIGEADH